MRYISSLQKRNKSIQQSVPFSGIILGNQLTFKFGSQLAKFFGLVIFCFTTVSGNAQQKINPTTAIEFTGDIKPHIPISSSDLLHYKIYNIGDLTILNHLGEKKGVQKKLKGVLLKDVLGDVELVSPGPKQLSEFYFTIIASDGYKVVYSWNEIFNSKTGDKIFLIVEKDKISIENITESILLVTVSDMFSGRRNVKAVKQIDIRRVK